jgi:serine/threonine protein kinase
VQGRPSTETIGAGAAARSAAEILFADSELGDRYTIREVLGTGGFGIVYRALDLELGEQIALKVLHRDRWSDGALKRFRREVAVARQVTSPHVVQIYDLGTAPGAFYLTMELVGGGTLAARLHDGPLPIPEVLRIVREILLGLAELHRLGIVHRDIKPGNVLLDGDGRAKVADFGLARRWEGDETRDTETGALVGTADYLAPEVVLRRELDPRTDLYSLGVLLYELLTGQLPHARSSTLGSALALSTSRRRTSAGNGRSARPGWPGSSTACWRGSPPTGTRARRPSSPTSSAGAAAASGSAARRPGSSARRGCWRGCWW